MTSQNQSGNQVESIIALLPNSFTWADIEQASVKVGHRVRAQAMRRFMRDNVPAYNERGSENRSLVLSKERAQDIALIRMILSHVGAGTQSGIKVPTSSLEVGSIVADLQKKLGAPVAPQAPTQASETPVAQSQTQGNSAGRK